MHNFLQDILKEANTIIIPGLGALTVTSTKTGDIYFMPFLKHDDGHLSKYVAQHEGIELSEAKQILANFVEAIKTAIEEGDVFEMEEFGRFLKNNEGEIDFQRWEDYQVVDNSILSKKIKEREKATVKPIVQKEIVQNTPIIEEPIANEPIKTDEAVHQQIEEELPISTNPIHLTVEETIIHPVNEEIITPISEEKEPEEFISQAVVTEQKSIDEILKNIEEEKIEVVQEEIIVESIIEPTIAQEQEMEASHELETEEPSQIPTESKKELRKRLKSEKALQIAEAKKQAQAAKLEQKESEKSTPKEKKKSKSILIWFFLAIVLTGGIMWYINDQRSKEVHLVAEKDGKTVVSKVVEKDELRSEIATLREKHATKKKVESEKKEEIKVASEEKKVEAKKTKEVKVVKTKDKKIAEPVKEKKNAKTIATVAKKTTPSPVKKEEKVVTKKASKPVAKPAAKPITTTPPSKTSTAEVKTAPKTTTNKSTSTNVASSTKETTPAVAKTKTTNTTAATTKPVATTPVKSTTPSASSTAKTTATPATKPVTPATTATAKPATPSVSKPATAAAKTTTPSGPTPYVSKNRNIHAMVGSFKDKQSADQFVANLKADGFTESYAVLENGIYNVSLGSYSTLSESYNAVKKYKSGKPAVK
jgi:hypothetical protein